MNTKTEIELMYTWRRIREIWEFENKQNTTGLNFSTFLEFYFKYDYISKKYMQIKALRME